MKDFRLLTNIGEYLVERYITAGGRDAFGEWFERLRDQQARAAVQRRLLRVAAGNLGDHKYLRDGVWELRITVGPGYRIYYGLHKSRLILLLAGGDKSTQQADISRAVQYWHDWEEEADANTQP